MRLGWGQVLKDILCHIEGKLYPVGQREKSDPTGHSCPYSPPEETCGGEAWPLLTLGPFGGWAWASVLSVACFSIDLGAEILVCEGLLVGIWYSSCSSSSLLDSHTLYLLTAVSSAIRIMG